MSYVRGSASDPTDMNSIERWFHGRPQSNVHDRLISGTSPQAQQVDPASARISQDLIEQALHCSQTDSKLCTPNGIGCSTENVPARSSQPVSGKPQPVPKRSSTAPSFTSRLGERLNGNIFHQFKNWISGGRLAGLSQHEPDSSNPDALRECETDGPSSVKRIRKRLGGRNGPNKSDSEEDKRTAKAKKLRTSTLGEKPRFACPFYQRHPGHYRPSRACSGSGFDTMHHLKQHLQRCHRGGVGAEQVTDEQWEKLENMRQMVCKKGRKEKWETLYKLLFPGDATIPCHYRHPKDPEPMNQVETSPPPPVSDKKNPWNDLNGFTRFVSWKGPEHVTKQLNMDTCSSSTGDAHAERTRFAAMFPDLVVGLAQLYLEEKGGSTLSMKDNPTRPINEEGAAIQGRGLEDPSANHLIPVPQTRPASSQLPQFPQSEPLDVPYLHFDSFQGHHGLPTFQQDGRGETPAHGTGIDQGFGKEESVINPSNDYLQPPTDFVSPQALQVDESDIPTAYTAVFSSFQRSDPEQGAGGSFTTAPPKDDNNQEASDAGLVDRILQDVPDIEGDDPFLFDYSPEMDVGAVGMDEDRCLYTQPRKMPENIPPHEMNG